ncbi:MAG TPA: N-acetylglucosamine-6-phosphate deacetylase [Pyrinomonadaceae bacterium]|nr:N-acetylglucosamine-6-phosphate deacetylase [Pyrinomonadaceae bacterium]
MNNTIARSLLLYNARIVLPETVIDSAKLLIKDGRISRVLDAPSDSSFETDSNLDLNGTTIFPGFVDMHIHGAVGVDVNNASANDLRHVSEFLASKGVTAWLPTLVPGPAEQYKRAVAAISELMNEQGSVEAGNRGARILGVHYEGPFVNSEQCGALHREHFRKFASVDELDSLPTISNRSAVHMMTVAPEVEGGIELIRELRQRGWIVSIGHTRATPDVLDEAKDAGAQHMTHFMNAMSPLHHRAPGPVGWGLLNDDIGLDVIADGVHLDPLMLKILLRTMTSARLSLISDAIAATGQGDGDYEIWGEKITVQNGRTQNARGNIAGSVITMLDAVKTMLTLGASECDVARMCSLNPARLLGVDRDCGSIEEGKRADLVALNERGEIELTLVGGQVTLLAH